MQEPIVNADLQRFLRRGAIAALLGGVALVALRAAPARTEPDGPFGSFVEPDFPFITSTVDAGGFGPAFAERNLSVRCVVIQLGNRSYACFDPDLLRMSVAWQGDFLALGTVAQVSYNQAESKDHAVPRIQGTPIVTTGIYPGWAGAEPRFSDPRPAGPYEGNAGRGPIDPAEGRWNGLHLEGDRVVLSYTVRGTDVLEQPASVEADGETGFVRAIRTGAVAAPLTLVAAEVGAAGRVEAGRNMVTVHQPGDSATVIAVADAPRGARLQVEQGRYVTLRIPAGTRAADFRVVAWRGSAARRGAFKALLKREVEIPEVRDGGAAHWPGTVATEGQVAPDTAAYVVDRIALPIPNPWKRNVRVAGIDFFADGRAALATIDGDVWTVSGIDGDLDRVEWKRFASGLYEPLSLQVVGDQVYVYGREGVVRLRDLNADGEADFYENFNNLVVQSGETREFPMDLVKRPGGGFFIAVGGALNNGPKTSPKTFEGFRAGGQHSGTVLEIPADGRGATVFATGFREPFIGVHPRTGVVTASDQQGNYVPSTPIFLVERGAYYGVPATAHRDPLPEPSEPLLWIPHAVDQSGASQVWVTDPRMGFGGDALVHISYGRPGPFRVLIDSVGSTLQGAIVPFPGEFTVPVMKGAVNPRDGQLYLAGFQIWGSRAKEISGLLRVRHTGRPSPFPTAVRPVEQGILLTFGVPLDPATATDPSRYRLQRWNYVRTEQYGSGHFKLDGTPGQDRLPVAAQLSRDRRSVLLVTPEMREVMQLQLDYDLRAADGTAIANSAYLTARVTPTLDLAAAGFGTLDWRAAARSAATAHVAAAAASSAEAGARIVQSMGCVGCHSIDGGTQGKVGPSFKGLYGTVRRFTNGANRRAYEDYLRQSILEPSSEVVTGFEPGMPSYLGVLGDAEIDSVILYIRSLAPAE